jgi:prevent-host-death family protein
LSISEAREDLAETVTRVGYTKERVVIQRRGKQLAALVPIEDLELLERLEDAEDLKVARRRLKSGKFNSLDEVKKELGL